MKKKLYIPLLTATIIAGGLALQSTVAAEPSQKSPNEGNYTFRTIKALELEQMLESKSQTLGIPAEELKDKLNNGQNFKDIIVAEGWTLEEFRQQTKENHRAIHLFNQAELLGITEEDLQNRLDSGQTFQEVAESMGISQEELRQKKQARHQQKLEQLVAEGVITQEQAGRMLSKMQEHYEKCQSSEDCQHKFKFGKFGQWRGNGGQNLYFLSQTTE